ncbi:Hypothetical protein FKW44_009994, partial [Caligus rogercresseyi]
KLQTGSWNGLMVSCWTRKIVEKKRKSKPGELPEDELLKAAERDFKVNVHSLIMEIITQSIHQCFTANGKLTLNLPDSILRTSLNSYWMAVNDQAIADIYKKLKSLATHWERLKLSALEEYKKAKRKEKGMGEAMWKVQN